MWTIVFFLVAAGMRHPGPEAATRPGPPVVERVEVQKRRPPLPKRPPRRAPPVPYIHLFD